MRYSCVSIMNTLTALLTLLVSTEIRCRRTCDTIPRPLRYYRIKECKKSNLPILSWSDTNSLRDCISFAKRRRSLAFNYSPREGNQFINGSQRNCQLLGCPEIGTSNTFVSDVAFDYYSSFGHLNSSSNATCIKNIGIFYVLPEKKNHTLAEESCKSFGGELADVSSEVKTKHLSEFLNTTLESWFRVAYVGMDDMHEEGKFVTASGLLLSCTNYRAWAPGHPRSVSKNEDCVVLDSEKLWRVVNCNAKLSALCELFPGKPTRSTSIKKDCRKIKDKSIGITCEEDLAVLEGLKNITRIGKCNILNNSTSFGN